MEKLLLVAWIGVTLTVLLRSLRPEYALPIGAVTGALLLLLSLEEATGLFSTLQRLGTVYGVSDVYITALLKMIGIAYLTQFGVNLCRDFGQSATAGKLELGGRICVLSCAVPAVVSLLEMGLGLLNEVLT